MSNFFERISVIAEVAQSYEGSFELAWASIDAAAQAGADCINFQVFYVDELCVADHHHYALFHRIELPLEQWRRLFAHARARGLSVIANGFGSGTAESLATAGVDAFKIHAADTANIPFLRRMTALGVPILVSVSGSLLSEVSQALRVLQSQGRVDLGLILGFQDTPTAIEHTHLARIRLIKERFGLPTGYADHIDAELPLAKLAPLLAVAAGADFIEKHINLDRSLKREDYVSSLNPGEFAEMVVRLTETRAAVGVRGGLLGEAEQPYRDAMKKRVVARRDLAAGQRLTYDDLELLRTDTMSDLWSMENVVGRALRRPVGRHDVILAPDLAPRPSELKRLVAVLLCRATSTRLHAKPLQMVGDRTILEHLIDQIGRVPRINQVVLAISEGPDNSGFVALAHRLGVDYVIGDELDGLGRLIQAAAFAGADTVFRVTTENPFLELEHLPALIETHLRAGADLTVCERLPEGTYAEVIELAALQRSHADGGAPYRTAWASRYIFEHPERFTIIKQLPPEALQRPDIRLTVDYPEDLVVVRKIYEAFEGKMPIPIASIIRFLDEHPEIKAINGKIEAGAGRIWQ